MLNFIQKKRLKELKNKYSHELAVYKQKAEDEIKTDKEILKSLLILDINRKMVNEINSLSEIIDNDKESIYLVSGVLAKTYRHLRSEYAKKYGDANKLDAFFKSVHEEVTK